MDDKPSGDARRVGRGLAERGGRRFASRRSAQARSTKSAEKSAALPADAPFAEWGRWFLADRATRSIAPAFTITPAETEKLAASMAPPATATPARPPPGWN